MILKTNPNSRFNNRLILSKKQNENFIKNNNYFINSFYTHFLCQYNDKKIIFDKKNFDFSKKSFVYIITETVAEYPYPYFSEKIWKAMLFKTPFMLIGAKHSLKKLKEFGFKTFDTYWDESYDNLETAADRIDAIVDILIYLSKLEKSNIDDLYQSMLPILEHNQMHIKEFQKQQINNIENLLNQNDF